MSEKKAVVEFNIGYIYKNKTNIVVIIEEDDRVKEFISQGWSTMTLLSAKLMSDRKIIYNRIVNVIIKYR